MPRLKEVPKNKANAYINKYYDALFGDRDPAQEPGTATGTPGNWWTVVALKSINQLLVFNTQFTNESATQCSSEFKSSASHEYHPKCLSSLH